MKVLVVVDMQQKFIAQCSADDLVGNVVEKIKRRRTEGYDIVLTHDLCGGITAAEVVGLCSDCKVYQKRSYGCKQLILDLAERKPTVVEFVGLCTDICVIANAMGVMAFLPYAEIVVDSRCCASTKEGHEAALRVMKSCNIKILGGS